MMSEDAACTLGNKQSQARDETATTRLLRAVKPQQPERRTALARLRRFTVNNGEDGPAGGPASQETPRIVTREGVFEIGRNGERFQRFVRKLLGEDAAEARAQFLARHIARGASELRADELQAIGPGAAEALDRKREALLGMIGDRKNSPREVVLLRPQIQKRLLRGAADFPQQCGEHGNSAAIFANFDGSGGSEIAQGDSSSAASSTP